MIQRFCIQDSTCRVPSSRLSVCTELLNVGFDATNPSYVRSSSFKLVSLDSPGKIALSSPIGNCLASLTICKRHPPTTIQVMETTCKLQYHKNYSVNHLSPRRFTDNVGFYLKVYTRSYQFLLLMFTVAKEFFKKRVDAINSKIQWIWSFEYRGKGKWPNLILILDFQEVSNR